MNVSSIVRSGTVRTLVVFVLVCAVGFGYLWSKAGGDVPGVSGPEAHRYVFETGDAKNLLSNGEVRIAGVDVGRVEKVTTNGSKATVEFTVEDQAGPLHDGVTVRVGIKSLVGAHFIEVVDGEGEELADERIPDKSVIPAVDVDELYEALDPQTREHLQNAVGSLDVATRQRGEDLDAIMTSLGVVGNEGATTLDALGAQSEDLAGLTREARVLIDALDTGRGQIADLVSDANTLTEATSAKSEQLEQTVEALPGLVETLRPAASQVTRLGGELTPVARDLRAATPSLNKALLQLPETTEDLNLLVEPLDDTLMRAPQTVDRLSPFARVVSDIVPQAQVTLSDLNPMLSYLAPYGLDLGALFASFGGSFDTLAEDGIRPIRLTLTGEGLASVRNNPLAIAGLLNQLPVESWLNPYPGPEMADKPKPFHGSYPQVERDE